MSCAKKKLDCKDCDCDSKKSKFEECCPKECSCMSSDEYEKLKNDHDSSPPDNYSYVKDPAFVIKLCKAQYKSSKGVKDDGSKCKVTRNSCQKKSKCFLVPYSEQSKKCCPGQTGHHLIPGSLLASKTERKDGTGAGKFYNKSDHHNAPTVCVAGGSHSVGTHGLMHYATKKEFDPTNPTKMSFDQARDASAAAHKKVYKKSNCDYECMKTELNNYYSDDVKKGEYERKKYGCAAKKDEVIKNLDEITKEIGRKIGTAVDLFT